MYSRRRNIIYIYNTPLCILTVNAAPGATANGILSSSYVVVKKNNNDDDNGCI
jgi:hypothetical protein